MLLDVKLSRVGNSLKFIIENGLSNGRPSMPSNIEVLSEDRKRKLNNGGVD